MSETSGLLASLLGDRFLALLDFEECIPLDFVFEFCTDYSSLGLIAGRIV